MDERCPFRRRVGGVPALVNCPEVHDPCPCVQDLLRHVLGEVDVQTIKIVIYWMTRDPMACDPDHRELLPEEGIQDE